MDYTIILPGFSTHNKNWAEQVYIKLNLGLRGEFITWYHWKTGKSSDFNIDLEVDKILDKLVNKKYNLVAKSVGTLVAMKIIRQSPGLVNKIVLCGIPINDLSDQDYSFYRILHEIPSSKVVVIQNKFDPHGSSEEVKSFINVFSNSIKFIEKNADNHEYPYFEEIKREIELG